MKIVVCIKQVPDTKGGVKFNPDGTLDRSAMMAIMNPDDKAGLEAALRLKDQYGAEVTVLTMGLPKAEEVLREALAMGADKGILVTDRVLGGADTWATSQTIAGALRNLEYDLIITGRQAIDGDTAQVGPQIAEHLGLPVISYAAHPAVQHAVGLLHIKAAARARLGQPLGGQHLVGGVHRVDADPLLGGHRAAARQRGAGPQLPGADLIGQSGIQLLIQRGLCARVQFYHGKPFLLAP